MQATQAVKNNFKIDQKWSLSKSIFQNSNADQQGVSQIDAPLWEIFYQVFIFLSINENLRFTVSWLVNFYKSFGEFRNTPSPWLTLLLVLGKIVLTKFRVNQVKWYQFI